MSSRTRNSRRRDKTHVSGLIVLAIFLAIVAAIVAVIFSGIRLAGSWLQDLPDYTDADSYLNAEPTQILDADGNVIASLYLQNRKSITLDQVSPYVLKATVDTEDVRFYEHKGVDFQGILRAAYNTISGKKEGASTITQQLVRNTVLSDEQFEQTLRRKVREAYIAMQIEKKYSKDEILLMYLNTIYYGSGAYGIEAASETYFGKHCKDLTLAEAALLAGLPQSPSRLDPTKNPEKAKERRNTVLRRMVANGDLTQAEADAASKEDVVLNYTKPKETGAYKYPYFVDFVKNKLLKEFPRDTLFKSGLTVKTTINPTLQGYAENAVMDRISKGSDQLEGALVSIDPSNGHIVAMVGGRDFDKDQFNLATQARRQAGSSFKVFTLVAAISAGMDPDTKVSGNSPAEITPNWTVKNFANASYGVLTLRQATWKSSNTAYARVAHAIGAGAIVDTAKKMGITSKLDQVESLTLGVSGVSPLEMASAYATLAADGVHRSPVAISEILDRNGKTIFKAEDDAQQVLDPRVADAATDVLEGVITSGTGTAANPHDGHQYAGKTGTTQDTRDLWFVGYCPQLSTAVWTGYRKEATIMFQGGTASTGKLPSPIWKQYMTNAMADKPKVPFPKQPKPDYAVNPDWGDLGVSATPEIVLNAAGQAYVQSLLDQHPGYKVEYQAISDPFTPAGQVIGATIDDATKTIYVRVVAGNPDDANGDGVPDFSGSGRDNSFFDNLAGSGRENGPASIFQPYE